MFRNKPHHRFERRIHEQILEAITRNGGQIERSNLYVIHSGYDYSTEGQKKKRERDLTILELEEKERPNDPFTHWNIGMTAHHLKNWDRAITALERSLQLSKPHESTVRKIYALLAAANLDKGALPKAVEWLEQGLCRFPRDPELLFRAGIIYREVGNLPMAERSYLMLLREPETGHIDSLDASMMTYKCLHNLAVLYMDRNRLNEAEEQWKAALNHCPDFPPSLLGLGELYLKQRRFAEVRTVLTRLALSSPEQAESLRHRLLQAEGIPPHFDGNGIV